MPECISLSGLAFQIATSLTLTMRAMAIVAGILVFIDCFKIWTGIEKPPHNPIQNANAWAILSVTAAVGGAGLISYGQPTIGGQSGFWPNLIILFIWTGLATGLVYRASTRAHRSIYIWASSTLFITAGSVISLLRTLGIG